MIDDINKLNIENQIGYKQCKNLVEYIYFHTIIWYNRGVEQINSYFKIVVIITLMYLELNIQRYYWALLEISEFFVLTTYNISIIGGITHD